MSRGAPKAHHPALRAPLPRDSAVSAALALVCRPNGQGACQCLAPVSSCRVRACVRRPTPIYGSRDAGKASGGQGTCEPAPPNARRDAKTLLTSSVPDRARTYNLRLRRPTLYPIELRERTSGIVAHGVRSVHAGGPPRGGASNAGGY